MKIPYITKYARIPLTKHFLKLYFLQFKDDFGYSHVVWDGDSYTSLNLKLIYFDLVGYNPNHQLGIPE
jgi:hypothetical protein